MEKSEKESLRIDYDVTDSRANSWCVTFIEEMKIAI